MDARESEGLWDWNLVSNRIHFSPRWLSLLGCQEHEVGSTREAWLQRVHPEDVGRVTGAIEAHLAAGPAEFDVRHRMLHKDGSYRWMSCHGVVQRNAAGVAVRVTGSHVDVTADMVTDPLTGLPNRLLLMERLTRSIERASRYQGFHFAVLLIDLDRQLSPEGPAQSTAVDPLLAAAARRLETSLRTGDSPPTLRNNDMVARVQADQFAILLDGLKELGHAKIAADRILSGLLAPFTLGGRDVLLSASIGIAVSATGYSQADEVLRDAETALHRAKLLGRARCEVFDTEALRSAQAELRLEDDLREALERDELRLFYQPILSLASSQIVGLEALARWQHPVLGMIPPVDFIPLAEKAGLIVPLGEWALREACRQLKAWQNDLPLSTDVWVSVNLSSLQFRHPGLADQVGAALRDSGLEPRCLVLELTEGIAMENPSAAKSVLMQLRAMGVRISVDDFGTGHSSLAYLRQLPVDSLKVDRSFIRGIEANGEMAEIFGAVTAMARQLGLYVVAEGIENERQLALVRSLRCESAQGYFLARPLDHHGAGALLKTGLADRLAAPQQDGGSGWRSMRRIYGVAAAATLLISIGLLAGFTLGGRPPASSNSPTSVRSDIALSPSAGAVESPPPAVPSASGVDSSGRGVVAPARTLALAPVTAPLAPVTAPLAPVTAPLAPVTTPRVVEPQVSVRVAHQHRLGSCRGLLIVSRSGLAFVPDESEDHAEDAFSFTYDQFLHEFADGSLAVRSNSRTYRFKPATAAGKVAGGDALEQIVAGIARLR